MAKVWHMGEPRQLRGTHIGQKFASRVGRLRSETEQAALGARPLWWQAGVKKMY
jgi:hypothetical protein